jgi:DNA-binding IclR family transcriptional regulator
LCRRTELSASNQSTDCPAPIHRALRSILLSDQLSTVAKTLRVLEAFSYAEPVLGVSELARKLGMGKSSVHRALSTLLEHGYVSKTADDRYRLGLKLHELGQLVVSGIRLHEVAREPLDRLRSNCHEAIHLAVVDGADVVYIDRFESPGTARMFNRLGRRMPAHVTSSGKCILAFGEPTLTETVLARGLSRLAPRSITTKSVFIDCLAKVRSDGYAVSVEESQPGVTSVAAPVFGRDGSCIAAVSLVGAAMAMTDEQLPKFTGMVRKCAREISDGMGFGQVRRVGAPIS